MSTRAVLSRLFLVWGAGVGLSTTIWLGGLGGVPDRWAVPALLLVTSLVLGFVGGWLCPDEPRSPAPPGPQPLNSRSRWPRFLAAAVALGAFAWTWILQNRPDHPLEALVTWAVAIAAIAAAFPGVAKVRSSPAAPIRRGPLLAVAAVVLLAAAARLIRLDLVQPVFSGDEATVAMDGRDVLKRRWISDPFGTGANSSMHMGMFPAGAGAILFDAKLAGPRFFCGVIGTLSVAATAGAAAVLAGPWAALGAAALIAFSPHHVHFSRSSNNVVVDSLLVTLAVLFLFLVLRTGSPRQACLAGVCSGLALYGYGGGRIMPIVLLASLPLVVWRFRGFRRRQAFLVAAAVVGFLVAAGPNLHFAKKHFGEWNGRFNQTSVFSPHWNRAEVQRLGSQTKMLVNQVRLGTIGLLSSAPTIDIFTGVPMIGPTMLTALGIAGLGWLYGLRRYFAEAAIVTLVIGGNLAGVCLTLSTPEPQRASSLVPMLAILGGVALAGFLTLFPERAVGVPWRASLAALLVGGFLARQVSGFPLDWIPYAGSGGRHAALSQSICRFVEAPRYARETIYFHGAPFVFWDNPSFNYFLPDRKSVNVEDGNPKSFPPGLHVCSEEYLEKGRLWARSLGLTRGVSLPHPAFALQDIGYAFLVRPSEPAASPATP